MGALSIFAQMVPASCRKGYDTGSGRCLANLVAIGQDQRAFLYGTIQAQMVLQISMVGFFIGASCSKGHMTRAAWDDCQSRCQMTRKSHVTAASLWRDIETIKKREVAFDDEEHSDGLRCVAAPIFEKPLSREPKARW